MMRKYIYHKSGTKKGDSFLSNLLIGFPILSLIRHIPHIRLIRHTLLLIIAFSTIIGIFLLIFKPKNTQASWFNDSWAYRQIVAVTNSGSALTDYQIVFTLDTATLISAGKMQTNCADLQITDGSGNKLPFWIQSDPGCNNANTQIWTKLPSISTSGTYFYVYYGNPSVNTEADGRKVFLFFDDFSHDGLDQTVWTPDSATANAISSTNNEIQISENEHNYAHIQKGWNTDNILVQAKLKTPSSFGGASWAPAIHLWWNDTSNGNMISWRNRYALNGGRSVTEITNGTDTEFNGSGNGVTTYRSFRIKLTTSNIVYDYTDSGNSWTTHRTSTRASNFTGAPQMIVFGKGYHATGYTNPELNNSFADPGSVGTTYIDDVFVAKLADTAPTVGSPSTEEKSPGPIGYWKFDDGTGTNAQDSTANNIDGTLTGTPDWQTEDLCVSAKCLYFNGSTDYVNLGTSTKLQPTALTASAWFRTNQTTGAMILRNRLYGYGIEIGNYNSGAAAGTISFWIYNSSATLFSANSSTTYNDNKWHLAQGVYDGSNVYIYVDGVLKGKSSAGTIHYSGGAVAIGRDADNAAGYFTGFIDEPKIYNFARTADQIKLDYNSKMAAIAKGAGTILGAGNNEALNNGLVGYWKLDESSGNAADSSGNATTLTNTNVATYTGGKFGNAASLASASTQYFTATDNTSLSMGTGQDFTLSSWVYLTTNSSEMNIMSKSNASREYIFRFGGISGNTFNCGTTGGNVEATTFGTPSTSTWYFLVCRYDAAKQELSISINNGDPQVATGITAATDTTMEFDIGAEGAGSHPWNGRIDEARVYKRLLSPAEVSQLYNFAPGPMLYLNFDEKTGSTLNDRSGSGLSNNNASIFNNPVWTGGKYGSALNYSVSNDYGLISPGTDYKFPLNSNFSVSAWVKTTQTGNVYPSFVSNESFNDRLGTMLALDGNTGYAFFTSRNSCCPNATGTTVINDGNWHYLTGVKSEDYVYIYVDGKLDGTPTSGANVSLASAQALYIGRDPNDYYNLDGSVDEVRIYNYARTQKQIIEDMNAGHPAVGTPVGSTVGHWSFDEGQGTTAYDQSPQRKNGTLNSIASPATATSGWTNSGKFGKGLILDGSSDSVSVAGGTLYCPSNITASIWVNPSQVIDSSDDWILFLFKSPATGSQTDSWEIAHETGTNNIRVAINNDANGIASVTQILSANTWYHLVATYNQSQIKLFINGVLKATKNYSTAIGCSSGDLQIGRKSTPDGGSLFYFPGTVDEVKIYPSALTDDEVKTEYNQGKSLVLGAQGNNSTYEKNAQNQIYCVPGDTTSCATPVAEWNFSEAKDNTCSGGANDVCDTSGNANDGAWNGTGSHWTQGKVGWGGKFNGSDDYVDVGSASILNFGSGNFTYSAWIKTSTSQVTKRIIGQDDNSTNHKALITSTDGTKIDFWCRDSSNNAITANGITAINDGKWHYIVGLRSGSNGYVYVDGKLDASATNASTGSCDNTAKTFIGARNTASPGLFFTGQIDQVRTYNYARTPSQIAWDYNQGKPVAQWDFDECQGINLYDNSGNGNTGTWNGTGGGTQTSAGTCTNSATTAWYSGRTGKYNASLNFDGTDDYVSVGSNSVLNLSSVGSVSMWFKATSLSTDDQALLVKGANGSTFSYGMHTESTPNANSLGFFIDDDGSWGPDCLVRTNANTISTGSWYLATGTWDGSNIKIYLNGVLVSSSACTISALNTSSNLGIGNDISSVWEQFPGQIDDVRIYNYTLTETQVRLLYNQSSGVRFGPETGNP